MFLYDNINRIFSNGVDYVDWEMLRMFGFGDDVCYLQLKSYLWLVYPIGRKLDEVGPGVFSNV